MTQTPPQPDDTPVFPPEGNQSEESVSPDAFRLGVLVDRCQKIMAHAWMIRTFIKHCDEVEDYPDLNEMARTIFDTFRALETQVNDPASYFKVVRKKVGKLKSAAVQYQKDAWHASTHTNFQQSAISALFIAQQLAELLAEAEQILPRPAAPKFVLPGKSAPPVIEPGVGPADDSD